MEGFSWSTQIYVFQPASFISVEDVIAIAGFGSFSLILYSIR